MVSGAWKEESILILYLWSATCSVQGPPLDRGGWLSGLGRTLSGMPMPIEQERTVDAPTRVLPHVEAGDGFGNGGDGVSIYSVRRVAVLMMIESKSFLGGILISNPFLRSSAHTAAMKLQFCSHLRVTRLSYPFYPPWALWIKSNLVLERNIDTSVACLSTGGLYYTFSPHQEGKRCCPPTKLPSLSLCTAMPALKIYPSPCLNSRACRKPTFLSQSNF